MHGKAFTYLGANAAEMADIRRIKRLQPKSSLEVFVGTNILGWIREMDLCF